MSRIHRYCLFVFVLLAPMMALAADPSEEIPVTGNATIDTGLKFLGAIYIALTVIVTFLPKTLPLAHGIARWVGDIRKIMTPEEVRADRKGLGGDDGFALAEVLVQLGIGVTLCGIIFALFVAAGGCAAAKPACSVVHIADEACQTFLVQLPDGTTERLAVEDVQGLAKMHRQMRLGGPK